LRYRSSCHNPAQSIGHFFSSALLQHSKSQSNIRRLGLCRVLLRLALSARPRSGDKNLPCMSGTRDTVSRRLSLSQYMYLVRQKFLLPESTAQCIHVIWKVLNADSKKNRLENLQHARALTPATACESSRCRCNEWAKLKIHTLWT
jgi:hypothetical protein